MSDNFLPLPCNTSCTVCIVGLGYVGLPLALAFSQQRSDLVSNASLDRKIIGFDVNEVRVSQLNSLHDITLEVDASELKSALESNLSLTCNPQDIISSDVFIVTVPTPIDISKRPDTSFLEQASQLIESALLTRSKDTAPLVIYESTVFPGATEEICLPILELTSNLKVNNGFYIGYSPERIVPGDKIHTFTNIVKVTSGSSEEAALWIDQLYASVVKAGTFKASSIKVAEAAKVIENTQRDLNIALVNELAIIFERIGVDTLSVLEAAKTKWNFLPFQPGLVGGHCIGVDPYYLTFKSEQLGYSPQVVLSGRRINDEFPRWISSRLVQVMSARGISIPGARMLILGYTFKENCPDIRNTRIKQLAEILQSYNVILDIVDPWVNLDTPSLMPFSILSDIPADTHYDCIIAAVSHSLFVDFTLDDWKSLCHSSSCIFDLKGFVPLELKPIRI